ncbi:2-polyprenyl-6-methoxyphenol hydroxylase [Nakamurella panacisegetis]|uniref:2-polyprenyl-6-methoxyphenol hydroxylase n=1 Tax=Nakamurella panacisegetis TaxID=1090615 RepID=A0A1H0KTC3_9ACTN|nr:FAD-dependent monooxygenase [Nakamurella panacisegetis]SDO59036.1 2-polyprenyl-6-methoxyphenol hydroxylase [Nakamurella panacisegetis]
MVNARISVEHVVVIGASAAGLFAAAAASGAGARVTVLERDETIGTAQPRYGVPQGRHPHVFLHRGLQAAEEFFPGLRDDLMAVGARPFDTAKLAWLGENGWSTRNASSYQVLSTTRPRLEACIAARVAELPWVTIRNPVTATGLTRSARGWSVILSDGSTLDAELVVDASGRTSRFRRWLTELAGDAVRTTEVDAKIGYSTRVYEGDPDLADVPGVVIGPTPEAPRGGLALPVEGGRWMIMVLGMGEHRPPRGNAGFDEFLTQLRDPALAGIAARLNPVGDAMVYRQTSNVRHHYEALPNWPDGLLVAGDALCAFNPVYGQGISVAAAEALALREVLRDGPTTGWSRRLMTRFADLAETPWSICTGQDRRYRSCPDDPTRLEHLSNQWALQLGRLQAHGNLRAARTLSGVYHLMTPTRQLFHPALIAASVAGRFRGYGPLTARPAGLPAA